MTKRHCLAVLVVIVLFSFAAPIFAAQTQTKLDGSGNLQFDVVDPSNPAVPSTYKMNSDGTFSVPGTSDSVVCNAAHRGALRWNLDKQIFEGCYYI